MIGIFNDCYPPVIDGVSVTVQNYARWLNRKCGDVCVVTPAVPGAKHDEDFPVYDYFSVPIPMRKPYRMGMPYVDLDFRSRISRVGFSIVHAHSPFSSGRLALRLARQQKVPLVATFHSKYRADFERVVPSKTIVDYLVKNIVDFYNQADEVWVPQAGISLRAARNGVLKASVSKGFRNPTIKDLYMFGMKNPDLRPERVWNYELAWSHQLADGRLTYGLNLFWIEGRDIIQTVQIDGRPKLLNQARVENRGIEAEIAWHIAKAWRADANYSYLWMKYPVQASPEHKLYTGINFLKNRWQLSAGVQYVEGLYTSVAPGAEIQENFVLLNLRASFRVNSWLTIYARGENLLAREYEIMAGYPMPRATAFGGIKLNF